MLVHAIMAGGIGSRLYGAMGGLKPLEPIASNYALIDYVLDEGRYLEPDDYVVAIGVRGLPIVGHIAARVGLKVNSVLQTQPGTGGAVLALLEDCPPHSDIFLTTADLFGQPRALGPVLERSTYRLNSAEPTCVIAVSERMPSDPSPIYVHAPTLDGTNSARVQSYGKSVAVSNLVFSGARLVNAAFACRMLDILRQAGELPTDTQLMSALINQGATVFAVLTPTLFDVDDSEGLASAKRVYQSSVSRLEPPTSS